MPTIDYPIVGWCSLSENLTRPEVFENIARCGINVIMTAGTQGAMEATPKLIRRQLDLAKEAGIKALVCDPRLRTPAKGKRWKQDVRAALDDFAGHDATFGLYVKDEPPYHELDAVGEMVQFLRQQAPGKLSYVNSYGFGPRGAESFFEYAEEYARRIRPDFLSFDAYPISAIPPKVAWASFYEVDCGFEIPQLNSYYRDCHSEAWETFHRVGWKYNLPLWGFVLSTPHQHAIWLYGPVTEGTLRLEAFTGLAYGVQATQYFTLPTVSNGGFDNVADGGWEDGILTLSGEPSQRFEAIRRVNDDLKVLGPIIRGLTCTGVYYHGGTLTSGCKRFTAVRPGKDSTHKPVSRIDGDPLMIGFLKGPKDERYAMMVNRNPALAARAQITLDEGWNAAEVSKHGTGEIAVKPSPFFVSLKPGDGRLLRFKHAALGKKED